MAYLKKMAYFFLNGSLSKNLNQFINMFLDCINDIVSDSIEFVQKKNVFVLIFIDTLFTKHIENIYC